MLATILVPLDGSELARRALPYAAFLARAGGGRLILFHAAPERALARDSNAEIDTVLEHDQLVDQLRQEGITATAEAVRGEPGPAIVRAAADLRADLIVMSTHGRGGLGRIVHGSVAEQIMRDIRSPILLVTAACDRRWTAGQTLRILVPLDGSTFAEEALGPVLELARSIPAEVRLLRAVEERYGIDALGLAYTVRPSATELAGAREYLEHAADRLRRTGQTVSVHVEAGRPDDAIARLVEREAIDLVVMATHGQGGVGRLLLEGVATAAALTGRVHLDLGSVAAVSVRRLATPVLLLRPAEVAQASASRVG